MRQQPYRNHRTHLSRILAILLGTVLLTSSALAQRSSSSSRSSSFRSNSGISFEIKSTVETLVADGESETTLVAFLADRQGNTFDNEEVRFFLQSGNGSLSDPGLGVDVSRDNPLFQGRQFDAAFQQESLDLDRSRSLDNVAVDGVSIGNGIYVARFRSGTIPGDATVRAIWLTAPDTPLPEVTTDIELVTAQQLTVRVDDNTLLADGNDEATIVAYVLDHLNRQVANAHVTFRVVQGSGTLTPQGGAGGRYVATYRSSAAPGRADIEVALPTLSRPIRSRITIDTVEAAELDAHIFPEQVARRPLNSFNDTINTSTVLVAVRDGDGDLVTELSDFDLVAQVIQGPGTVSRSQEIMLDSGEGSGVYQFTFTASEATGRSTIRVTNLAAPSKPSDDVTVRTVTQLRPSIAERLNIETYADDPFYADGQSQALIVLTAADNDGNAITGLDPDFFITDGQGQLQQDVRELDNLADSGGTGVYITTLVAGESHAQSSTRLRAVVANFDGSVYVEEGSVTTSPLGSPDVVVFPPRIPANLGANAVIDVFDFDAKALDAFGSRYRVDVLSGPGEILEGSSNDGSGPDLIAGDNLHSAVYEADLFSSNQPVRFRVIDTAASGFPSEESSLDLGQTTRLDSIAFPDTINRGELVQVVVFASDEFGLPAIGHDIILTLVSGSGEILARGQLFDDGGQIGDFTDAYASDGMYVGAFRASAIANGNVTLRITDTTPATQPTSDLHINVTASRNSNRNTQNRNQNR